MAKGGCTGRKVMVRSVLLTLAWLNIAAGPQAVLAQSSSPAQLETRRAQIQQFIQQQQVSLKNQLDCTSSARSLDDLDRCQRGYPRMGPGMHGGWGAGGWGCPPW